MNTTFENQLNQKEIYEGLITYINRQLWYIIVLLAVVVFLFLFVTGGKVAFAISVALFVAILGYIVLLFILKQQLSTDKIAIYKLHDYQLEIINSNGIIHCYKYSDIKSIVSKNVIILCLAKGSFAIIAKRNLNAEIINTLTNFK